MFGLRFKREKKDILKRPPGRSGIFVFFELLFRKFWGLCKANLLYVLVMIPAFAVTLFVVGILSSKITAFFTPMLAEGMGIAAVDMANEDLALSVIVLDVMFRMVLSVTFTVFLGMGPVTAGITYILRNYAREEHTWLWNDLWRMIKSNFIQSTLLWVLDIAVFVALVVAFDFYVSLGGVGLYLVYVLIFVAIMYLMMHLYVYQVMVTFRLSFKNVLKNSMLMAIQTVPQNLLMIAVLALLHLGIPYFGLAAGNITTAFPLYLLMEALFLLAVSGFMTNFFIYPTVEKYIKQAECSNKADTLDE